METRKFALLLVVAIAAASALPAVRAGWIRSLNDEVPEYDVAIVGAGLSGLNTARTLIKSHGVDPSKIVILEARNRVGGRTYSEHTTTLAGEPTRRDLGAEFVSASQTRLNSLLDEFGIQKTPVLLGKKSVFEHSDSEVHFSDWDLPIDGLVKACLMKGFVQLWYYQRDINMDEVWNSSDASWYDNKSVRDYAKGIFGYEDARHLFETLMSVMYGTDAASMPLLHLLYFIKSTGGLMSLKTSGDFHVVNGTQQISEHLASSMPGVRLELSAPVLSISYDSTGATLTTSADGKKFRAKHVVQTMPAPLANDIAYDPPMPEGRAKYTQLATMGRYTKIHVRCPSRQWTHNDLLKMGASYPGPLVCVVDGSYEKGLGDEGMLVGFILGEFAEKWMGMPKSEREIAVKHELHVMLDGDSTINSFDNCAYGEYEWEKDPFGRGVTVNLPAGVLSNPEIASSVKRAVGPIHFGGTETSNIWHGYMEGALNAGERVAHEVASALRGEPFNEAEWMAPVPELDEAAFMESVKAMLGPDVTEATTDFVATGPSNSGSVPPV